MDPFLVFKSKDQKTDIFQNGVYSKHYGDPIEKLREGLNLECRMGAFQKEDLLDADEIFLTNSLMDIMPVSQLEEHKLNLHRNDTTHLLQKAFFERRYQ